jgi:hypothetical protein
MRTVLAVLAAIAAVLVPSPAPADFHTFTIDQLYSSADGEIQFIVLREAAGANGQDRLGGHQVTSSHAGVVKTLMIPSHLPSSGTAGRRVLFASDGYVALRTSMPSANLPAPDYTIPNRFLATDGGIVNFAGVSQVLYPALPGDGTNARYADTTVAPNLAQNFSGASAQVPAVATLAVEYYHAVLDHFFVSSLAPDIDSLDSGRATGWARTTQTYKVMPIASGTPPAAFGPVCRFYIPPAKGDSHFFSAAAVECADVLQRSTTDPNYAGYVHETPSAYFAVLPNQVTGDCPASLQPLFRLWNQRVDSNHRYTVSPATRTEMIGRGFAPEGYGPLGVAMCVI